MPKQKMMVSSTSSDKFAFGPGLTSTSPPVSRIASSAGRGKTINPAQAITTAAKSVRAEKNANFCSQRTDDEEGSERRE